MAEQAYLAIDLGAESGRAVLGRLEGGRVSLEEVHRFPNVPVKIGDGLYWDVLRIFGEVKAGISKAGEKAELASIAVDSWGVDFGLLDRDGELISNPRFYRDPRTDGMMEEAFGRVSRDEIYARTGIQFMQINTLYQLLASRGSPLLEAAETLLLMPDLINYWLTGERSCELTNATTTQLYNLKRGDWDRDLTNSMDIPERIFPKIVPPATRLGPLLPEIVEETGLPNAPAVVTAASHDTASAVVAVPAEGEGFAYVSSGTWSLVGVETPGPVVTPEALAANFTNEGGFVGRTRFLKNVMGLWLLQECRKQWARDGDEYSYEELGRMAEEAPPSGPVVDPDHLSFLAPGDMPGRIRSFCEETGQEAPDGPSEMARCVFESLALKCRIVIEQAGELAGKDVGGVHIVGGGSQNSLLCQLTADATGLPVLAGPVEATAVGNVMVQALADGAVGSLEEIRAVVRASVEPKAYEPRGDQDPWLEASGRLRSMMEDVPGREDEGDGA
jgi:rhamnulokinase